MRSAVESQYYGFDMHLFYLQPNIQLSMIRMIAKIGAAHNALFVISADFRVPCG